MIGRLRRGLVRLLLGLLAALAAHIAVFAVVPVPLTPLMVIRATQGHGVAKTWVPLTEMSPELARAVIAAEDNRFCEHNGVDWSAVGDVVEEYRDAGRLRGASTISMQTVKNLYLWPGRSVMRKGLEVGLVHVLEAAWSKQRIVEVYLNIVEFGPGVYGVQAAARHHFDRDAAQLTAAQSAALASILPSPLLRDPTAETAAVRNRVRRIRRGIRNLGPLLDCVPAPPAERRVDSAPLAVPDPPPPVAPAPPPVEPPAEPAAEDGAAPSETPGARPPSGASSAFPVHSQSERKQRRGKKKRTKRR